MNSKTNKDGFTLVEILVATALIVFIVSMVYGSYFAVSKSTQACKDRIAAFQQGRRVLEQITRQIRCSYAPTADKHTQPNRLSQRKEPIPENIVNYFKSDPDKPNGEILRLVTTSSFWTTQDPSGTLFEVVYKLDKSRGLLSLSQERFVGASKETVEKRNWRPIVQNIECLELAFFDGQQWLKNWDFKNKGLLPRAVKIRITLEDINHKQYHYDTIAYICCQKNQGNETTADTLVAVKERWDRSK